MWIITKQIKKLHWPAPYQKSFWSWGTCHTPVPPHHPEQTAGLQCVTNPSCGYFHCSTAKQYEVLLYCAWISHWLKQLTIDIVVPPFQQNILNFNHWFVFILVGISQLLNCWSKCYTTIMFQLCYNENFQLCILDTGAVIETYSTLSMSPLWLKWFSGSTKDENTKF